MVILVLLDEMHKPLEDLKEENTGNQGIHFNLPRKKKKIMDLDMQMSDPDFWSDPDKAKKISQEATLLKTEVEGHEKLETQCADLLDFLDMAIEEKETGLADEIEKQYHALLKDIEKREVLLLLSEDTATMLSDLPRRCRQYSRLDPDAGPHVYALGRTARISYPS